MAPGFCAYIIVSELLFCLHVFQFHSKCQHSLKLSVLYSLHAVLVLIVQFVYLHVCLHLTLVVVVISQG
jgi:hypothetical protein